MKQTILITALITSSFVANAQWTAQVSNSTAELRGVFFTNPQTGYVVGSDATVLKTNDGGTNWFALTPGITDTLRSVFFTDDTTGYASGANGTIIKTTDAGNTWIPQVSGVPNLLRSIYFPSHDTGYIAGGVGVILKTTDGGANWVQQTSTITQDLISIRFINNDTGWAASSLSTFLNGIILKTTDGGTTWDTVYTNANGFLSVFCATADTIYCAGGAGTIAKSVDGGTTWNQLVSGSINILRAGFYHSGSRGYVSGDVGDLLYTNNGGATYTNQTIQTSGLLGMYFPHPDTGYVCGTLGTILKFTPPCIPETPIAVAGPQSVCENDTATFSISPVATATSYNWTVPPNSILSSGQGDTLISVIFGNTAGTVNVSATNVCGASAPFILSIAVNPAPIPGVTMIGNALFSVSATFFQWYFNGNAIPGATNSSYVPTQNGLYQALITDNNGCHAISLPYNVTNVGIEEYNSANSLMVSQNDHAVLFSSKKYLLNPAIFIHDLTGREVFASHPSSSREINVSKDQWTSGIYFYTIRSDNENLITGKMMVE